MLLDGQEAGPHDGQKCHEAGLQGQGHGLAGRTGTSHTGARVPGDCRGAGSVQPGGGGGVPVRPGLQRGHLQREATPARCIPGRDCGPHASGQSSGAVLLDPVRRAAGPQGRRAEPGPHQPPLGSARPWSVWTHRAGWGRRKPREWAGTPVGGVVGSPAPQPGPPPPSRGADLRRPHRSFAGLSGD